MMPNYKDINLTEIYIYIKQIVYLVKTTKINI